MQKSPLSLHKVAILVVASVILQGCSLLISEIPTLFKKENRMEVYVEPSFREDPVYNFKVRIDEGWEIIIVDGELMFKRVTEDGTEVYKPK